MLAMSKRLFVGIPVQIDSPLASLTAAIKKLRIGADRREMEFDWAPVENYHITLNFLGETPEEKLTEISDLIAQVADGFPPFETTLRGVGGFPDEHHARVLWIGARKSRLLSQMQTELATAFASIGYPLEERSYIPHMTIARTRKARSTKDLVSPYVRTKFGEMNVTSLALFESVMHGAKTHYEILQTFPLNPTAPALFETDESVEA